MNPSWNAPNVHEALRYNIKPEDQSETVCLFLKSGLAVRWIYFPPQVITDLTLTLSRLEQKENNTLDSVTIETYQIEEKGNTEGEAQLLKKSDSTTVEEVNLKQNVNSAYNEERRADFTSNEPREIVAVVEASPILEGSNASAEGISKRTTIGGSTDNNDSSRYDPARSRESGDLCDLELGPDELSDEVLAVFEQVRNDQRTCEEQLSTEQKQREVHTYICACVGMTKLTSLQMCFSYFITNQQPLVRLLHLCIG